MGSDGLWDVMSPLDVVRLVGEHMSGKAALQPFKLPKQPISLGVLNDMLSTRKYVL